MRALPHAHAGRDVPSSTTVAVLSSLFPAIPGPTTSISVSPDPVAPTASGSPLSSAQISLGSAVTVSPDPAPSSPVFPIIPDLAASDSSDDVRGSASATSWLSRCRDTANIAETFPRPEHLFFFFLFLVLVYVRLRLRYPI